MENLEAASHLKGRRNFDESIQCVRQWLKRCLESHAECGVHDNVTLPKRVLDLSDVADSDTVHLREQDGSAKISGRYACLSYCWGAAPRFMTTTSNLSQMKNCIRLEDMPKTFADAVAVCLVLNVQYLWIDALCIIQGDPADWTEQSVQMSSIYGQSYLTIIASNAESSHAGFISDHYFEEPILLRLIDSNNANVPEPRSKPFGFTEVWVRTGLDHGAFSSYTRSSSGYMDAPTRQRAWCLQEHLMPPRTISFGPSEIIFECRLSTSCECGYFLGNDRGTDQGTRFDHYQSLRTGPASAHLLLIKEHWLRLVQNYSSRATTFDSDRLAALAGIAEDLQKEIKCRYLAGLWEDGLLYGMMWETVGPTRRNTSSGLPTWSWVSVVGETRYQHGHDGDIMDGTRLLEVQYKTAASNIFGMPTTAILRISGCMLEVEVDISASWSRVMRNGESVPFSPDISLSVEESCDANALLATDQDASQPSKQTADSDPDSDLTSTSTFPPFYAWLLGVDDRNDVRRVRMLVLHALDSEGTRFERIGIAETVMYYDDEPIPGFAPRSQFLQGYLEEKNREFSLL
jgi:Heterokaryon incompatibility protein (HET)